MVVVEVAFMKVRHYGRDLEVAICCASSYGWLNDVEC